MEWSQRQKAKHEKNFENFREKYLKGENGSASVDEIRVCKRRCAPLICDVKGQPVYQEVSKLDEEIRGKLPGFYHQEIPHFTIDCHRYLLDDKLPKDINALTLDSQQGIVISDEELNAYDKIVREIIGGEQPYKIELRGVAIGGDGLIAQVWFDDARLSDLTSRLGEKVKQEVLSMDFKWGLVKNNVPIRMINLMRFTGKEDRGSVINYVDRSRNRELGQFSMNSIDLVLSDHYLQKKNTKTLRSYNFSK